MPKLFISHSSQDDGFVRGLRQALADFNRDVWIDSLRIETLHPAIDAICNAIAALSVFQEYDISDRRHSSSDGQRIELLPFWRVGHFLPF